MDWRHHGLYGYGTLGALAGYAIGSLFDKAAYAPENMDAGNETYTGQRNSFLFSLLVMASYIIRADGKSCIANGICTAVPANNLEKTL